MPHNVRYWKTAVYKKGNLPSFMQITDLLMWTNRLFFSDRFLKGRNMESENKENRNIGVGGSRGRGGGGGGESYTR